METIVLGFVIAIVMALLYVFCRLIFSFWVFPVLASRKLKRNGLNGPSPSFPFGNLSEMKKKIINVQSSNISHDIHSTLFPFFTRWQNSFGKMFVYWLGTEPFLYIADPELLKKLSTEVTAKNWGKPAVFRRDRSPMFGNGLLMSEGDDWVRHRHVITPAFNPTNLKAMASVMVETTNKMLDNWVTLIDSGTQEIDVEREIITTAGEIIAKTSFGISDQSGRPVFEKLRALQMTLFKTVRFVGVPFGKMLHPKKTLEARKLGQEINQLFLSLIDERRKSIRGSTPQHDLLGLLLKQSEQGGFTKSLTTQELVDECKTFFFGGHETTALAITWTMLLLATHQDWQHQLREEIREVFGDKGIDVNMLSGLKKMGWVMNEVFRLYPSAPNAQRQAKADIQVSNDLSIPRGTNMWIDIVGMHHDPALWGEDVNEFKPERFKDDIHGGCKHKMGYLPFGFGGRMCIGRNLTFLEYKIVLTLILTRFSFNISPTYRHSPSIVLSLRPSDGLPLVLQPL
ncbi:cytokinin hydroxylase-like [Pyrus x bretschneideri]|uniref:cytokinin hydroxylase-like n=1 Tax=Pyrus x bretschneideri TaxID=225117 RepID=UPI00202F94D9|nr:cytokinin hydroxylase-like [Pyrus x bretschneideri]